MAVLDMVHPSSRRNVIIAVSVVIVVAVVGLIFAASRAATQYAAFEAEQGTPAAGATVASDTNASGGKYVQFSSGSSGGGGGGGGTTVDLTDPAKREIAFMLVSSAENTTTDWRTKYNFIEYNVECTWMPVGQRDNCGNSDNRGYTAGIVGFTSATGDMLQLVQNYVAAAPGNVLAKYVNALKSVNGTPSAAGLGQAFMNDWKTASNDAKFKQAQEALRDSLYFNPGVNLAKQDGVKTPLGQFAYYDAGVMHGTYDDQYYDTDLYDIRRNAMAKAKTPAQGGDEKAYIKAFLDARRAAMKTEPGHEDTSRVDTMMLKFWNENNLALNPPLTWQMYGGTCSINAQGVGAGDCQW